MTCRRLIDDDRRAGAALIRERHYTRSFPSGKTHLFAFGDALIAYSIPANPYAARWLLGLPPTGNPVWELTRLWAPDGHAPNLLTQAIAASVSALRAVEPAVVALVSYADPNVGHGGGVYRAASWTPLGQSEEARAYRTADGQIVARRAFHSGSSHMTKAQIEATGAVQLRLPGKLRFARGLTRQTRRAIAAHPANITKA